VFLTWEIIRTIKTIPMFIKEVRNDNLVDFGLVSSGKHWDETTVI
jgi:hypothetical protein